MSNTVVVFLFGQEGDRFRDRFEDISRIEHMYARLSVYVCTVLIGMLLGPHGVAHQAPSNGAVLTPGQDVQTFLHAMLSANAKEMFSGTEEQFRLKLSELKSMKGGELEDLVPELLYFSIHAETMREGMLPGILVEQLGISKQCLARALVPYLNRASQTCAQ